MAWKPDGYTSVAPYLTVNDAAGTIAFLVQVFGAERLRMIVGNHGKIAHGEVRIGDTVVMLTDAVEGWPATPSCVHVYVGDVDGIVERAMEAGAMLVKPVAEEGDGDRRGGFTDAGGTTWWVSTQVG